MLTPLPWSLRLATNQPKARLHYSQKGCGEPRISFFSPKKHLTIQLSNVGDTQPAPERTAAFRHASLPPSPMGMPLPSTRADYDDDRVGTAAMPPATAVNGINGSAEHAAQPSTSMSADEARAAALQLGHQRAAIDDELRTLGETLTTQNATMNSPLVDSDGFPLANIDIVAVRTARARIIALRNDRNAVEAQMRDLVNVALARPAGMSNGVAGASGSFRTGANSASASAARGTAMAQVPGTGGALSMSVSTREEGDAAAWGDVGGLQPFAKVNTVANGSPAQQAGLQVDDEVLRFGELAATTAHRSPTQRDLGNLPTAVREGAEVIVMVLRKGTSADPSGGAELAATRRVIKQLRLTPASGWGGRGLLGCHLLPL